MEAGVEHFGRGIVEAIDTVLAVVEPSYDSMKMAEKIDKLVWAGKAAFSSVAWPLRPPDRMEKNKGSGLNLRFGGFIGRLASRADNCCIMIG